MGDGQTSPRPSLAEQQQQLTRARIRAAALEVVARRGFDATVDEIARLSGVSPRTIFRHYGTHERLLLSTVADMFEACGRRANSFEGDFDTWLGDLAVIIHTRNAEIIGEAFWDIHRPKADASEALQELERVRRESRRRGVTYLARVAWSAAGGEGDPPEKLVLAFALYFSAFTTKALMVDFDRTPAEVGRLTAAILTTVVMDAVGAQALPATPSSGRPAPT